jgi:flagellin
MTVANLGRTSFTEDFDGDGTVETESYSLQDILGGGIAALSEDPVKALDIIDQAIKDVSDLRARLGATQKNLLETNANSLNVAIENITATESSIRDADMAFETAEFSKNQIMVQAGTAMLAQANAASQSVLQLLG